MSATPSLSSIYVEDKLSEDDRRWSNTSLNISISAQEADTQRNKVDEGIRGTENQQDRMMTAQENQPVFEPVKLCDIPEVRIHTCD